MRRRYAEGIDLARGHAERDHGAHIAGNEIVLPGLKLPSLRLMKAGEARALKLAFDVFDRVEGGR